MKKCPKCGLTYDNDSSFCQVCGTPLDYLLDVDPAINGDLFEEEAADTADTPVEYFDEQHAAIGVEWEPAQDAGALGAGDGQWHTAPPVEPAPQPAPAPQAAPAPQPVPTPQAAPAPQPAQPLYGNGGAANAAASAADFNSTPVTNDVNSGFRQDADPNVGVAYGGALLNTAAYQPAHVFKRRSIAACIILSIVTFGIYFLYWIVKVNDDMDELAGTTDRTEGLTVLAISFVTLGIYFLYWLYKTGEKADYVSGKLNQGEGFSRILYLLLGIFSLSIISLALAQDVINRELNMRGIA